MLSRRALPGLGLMALAGSTAVRAAGPAASARPQAIVHTYLQALPGRRADLAKFIELNWLVMDRRGIAQGIFSHAVLLDVAETSVGDAAERYDFVMEVGYLTPGGYPDVETKFTAIRKAHKTVLVDGRGLGELGRILGERLLRPLAAA